tara:strand:+ start:8698 stop:9147 length:450 start_codon:yes stop_codon:yes gene_type:complete
MATPKSLGSYGDVYTAFSTAIRRNFVSLQFPTHSAAVRFRHRAYGYRNLLRQKQLRILGDPHAIVATDFDELVLRITWKGEEKAPPFCVEIEKVKLRVEMKDAEGNVIVPDTTPDPNAAQLPSPESENLSELEEAANTVAARLKSSFLG